MDQVRRALATIRAYLGKLTVSQQLLIASVVVVMLMTLFVVQQYAAKPDMVELLPAGASADDRSAAVQFLQANSVPHDVVGGAVRVPVDRRLMVISQMANQNALPSDGTILFNNLIDNSSWTLPQSQTERLATIALQNELNRIITHFPGVRSANVIINKEPRRPLGSPRGIATAAATVFSGAGLNQGMVDSVAHLVANATGVALENVRVIDGTSNRQWKAKSGEDLIATTNLELQMKIEERKRDQLYEMLAYIRGVIISVQAQVDVKKVASSATLIPKEGEGSLSAIKLADTTDMQETVASTGGEPGVRSNTGADINTGSSGGSGSTQSTSLEEFETFPGRTHEETIDPRGHATKVAAVVNIPRSYFVDIWKQQQGPDGEADTPPTDQELDTVRQAEINRITLEVQKLIDSSANPGGMPGEAVVSMIPVAAEELTPQTQSAGLLAGGAGGAIAGWIKTLILGVLALLSLGLIVITAMKASKQERLPSASELVGIPPALQEDADLVGEAMEADSQLEGIELSDEELKHHKQMEQVSGLVAEQPEQAAQLLNKWIVAGR